MFGEYFKILIIITLFFHCNRNSKPELDDEDSDELHIPNLIPKIQKNQSNNTRTHTTLKKLYKKYEDKNKKLKKEDISILESLMEKEYPNTPDLNVAIEEKRKKNLYYKPTNATFLEKAISDKTNPNREKNIDLLIKDESIYKTLPDHRIMRKAMVARDKDTILKLINKKPYLVSKVAPSSGEISEEYNIEIIQYLLDNNIDINVAKKINNSSNITFHSLLANAIFLGKGEFKVAKFLIKNGADINYNNNPLGWTPLHLSVMRRNTEITKILIDKGVDINQTNDNAQYNTPLHSALDIISKDFTKAEAIKLKNIVQLLINNSADLNIKNVFKLTPLGLAEKKVKEIKDSEAKEIYKSIIHLLKQTPNN